MIKHDDYTYTSLNNSDFLITVFFDYKKAFNTIHLQILSSKLELYVIRGRPLKSLKSYLQNRKYSTPINKSFSTEITSNIGLPQGSILSPLLFILYVNDLHKLSPRSSVLLFADDTTLLFSQKLYEQLISICNTK